MKTYNRSLGSVRVITQTGLWHKLPGRSVMLDLTAVVHIGGPGSAVSATLLGFFDPAEWNTTEDGLMYSDHAVEDAVNGYLAERGLIRGAVWSEQGAQSAQYVDFDLAKALIAELFPELAANPR